MALDSIMQGFNVASINTLPANDITTLINNHFIKAADETVTKTKYCKTSWRCWYWNDECTKNKCLYLNITIRDIPDGKLDLIWKLLKL